ncbi:MAG: DUF6159 family protein [Acidimicrobiia bacterium]|jgi:hypothetical protein
MGRIQRSWYLGKLSWRVLRGDRTLAAFPVLTAIGALVVVGVFGGLIALTGIDDTDNGSSLAPIGWVLVVAMYLVAGIVITFFQAALSAGANERLDGRDSTVGTAMAKAGKQFPAIAAWAVLQTTVSLVLQAIQERAGFVGDILAGLFGAAWRVVTFLAIPVVVLEGTGPFASLKRSGKLLSGTWGENLAAQMGFGLLGLVAALPGLALVGLAIITGSLAAGIPIGAVGVLWVLAVSVVVSAMTGIYKTALYRYAVDGKAPAGFAESDLADAFARRKG